MNEDATTGGPLAAAAKGFAAGLAGATAMTAAQAVEMRLSGREPSMVPAQVAARLLGLRRRAARDAGLNWTVHFAHGASMGSVRGLMSLSGTRGPAAAAAFFLALWSGDCLLYRALGIAPWPWRWGGDELAVDVGHKLVYAIATSAAYEKLDG